MRVYDPNKKMLFSKKEKEALENAEFGETGFGTIIADFEAVLKLVAAGEIELTPSLVPNLASAKKINAALQNPIELGLKRSVIKSYPHVLGLFLLLRASELSIVDEKSKTPKISLDAEMLNIWQSFNPTEKYFNLLETWLLRAYAEILGEWQSPWNLPDGFSNWGRFYVSYPSGKEIKSKNDAEDLKYNPTFISLACLEMFGFVVIERGEVVNGQAWTINRVQHTPIGIAFLKQLNHEFFHDVSNEFEIIDQEFLSYGRFQPIFAPYFPAWEKKFAPIVWNFRTGKHVFKVQLHDCWRRIAIDGTETLDSLADIILESVDFDTDHLYQFSYRRRSGRTQKISHDYLQDYPPFTSEILVGNVPIQVGQRLHFLFDMGDNWEFTLLLESAVPDEKQAEAEILESHGKAPEQYPNGEGYMIYFDEDKGMMLFALDDFDDEDFEDDEDE